MTLSLKPRFLLLVWSVIVFGLTLTLAQDFNEPHILPRSGTPHQEFQPPDLKTNVDLVLVPVTVLDDADKAVTGLRAQDFTVLDNKAPQTIRYFASQDTPISLTVILDASASMLKKEQQALTAAMQLFQQANPEDEFRLMTFGDVPGGASLMAGPVDDVQTELTAIRPHGFTALWDTLYLGIADLNHAEYERKAIVLITDGGDNHSRHSQSEIKSVLKEAGVQVYALGMFDANPRLHEEKLGPLLLDEVVSVTGGRLFSIYDPPELAHAVVQISLELRNQYVIGYYPAKGKRDGKWRNLKVRVVSPIARLRVYAKKGYYGPGD